MKLLQVFNKLKHVNKLTILLTLTIAFLAFTVPAFAHMGSMTKTVAGKVVKLSSFPLDAGHRYVLKLINTEGESLSGWQVVLTARPAWDEGVARRAIFTEKKAGEYETVVKFPQEGNWVLTLELAQGEKNLAVEFRDRVVSQPNSAVVLTYLALVILFYWSVKFHLNKGESTGSYRRNKTISTKTWDLLQYSPVKRFLRSKWYPGLFRLISVMVFVAITVSLLWGTVDTHSNMGWAITWLIWWPLVPVTILLLGRLWCAVCPLGTIADFFQRFFSRNKPAPRFLRKYGIWLVNVIFLFITWYDYAYGLVGEVRPSGVLLLAITLAAVLAGVLFRRRAFCRYLCPLGGLWGNYNVSSMVEIRTDQNRCKGCHTVDCYRGNERAAGCPMLVVPRTLESSRHCNLCANCIKACPRDAVKLNLRAPVLEILESKKASFDVAVLAAVLVGIVFVQNFVMLEVWQKVNTWLIISLGVGRIAAFTLFFAIAVAIPVLLIWAIAQMGGRELRGEHFGLLGLSLIPFNLGSHIAHNLLHLLAEGKLLAVMVKNIFLPGTATVSSLDLAANPTVIMLLDQPTIVALQNITLLLGAVGSFYAVYKLRQQQRISLPVTTVFMIVLAGFLLLNFWMLGQPMMLRS